MSGFLLIGKNICPHKSLGHQFVILCAPRPQQPADPIEPPPPPPPLTHSHYKGRGGSAACTLRTDGSRVPWHIRAGHKHTEYVAPYELHSSLLSRSRTGSRRAGRVTGGQYGDLCGGGGAWISVTRSQIIPKVPNNIDSPRLSWHKLPHLLHRAAESAHNRHRDIRFNEIYLLNIHSVATLHAKTKTIWRKYLLPFSTFPCYGWLGS